MLVLTPEEEHNRLDDTAPFTFSSIEYNISDIVKKIRDVENIHESELKQIILRQHKTILNYDLFLANKETREAAQFLFTNKKFLSIFLDVIGMIHPNEHEITCINKLGYDYHMSDNRDMEIETLLFEISNAINNNMVIRLSPYIGFNGAKVLSMIANSSFNIQKNVQRINSFIMKCDIDMTTNKIIDIFCVLYSRFSRPFLYTMLQAKPSGLSDEELKRFDSISVALLTILHSMQDRDIHDILVNYGTELYLKPHPQGVRFSIKSCTGFPRIVNIAWSIEKYENIVIP